MNPVMLSVTFAALFAPNVAIGQAQSFTTAVCDAQTATFNIQLPQTVLANGQRLAAGAYVVRITAEHPAPAAGQSPNAECWVEFVRGGAVAGRELASVVPTEEIGAIAKGPAPQPNQSRVDLLKEGRVPARVAEPSRHALHRESASLPRIHCTLIGTVAHRPTGSRRECLKTIRRDRTHWLFSRNSTALSGVPFAHS